MSNLLLPGNENLWLPGHGLVPTHIRQAIQALEEYDRDLSLAREENTGEWIVMLSRGPEGRAYPAMNLGTELPTPEEIKRKLYRADTRRRAREIVAEIDRKNEGRKKQLRDEAHDGAGEAAEAMDLYHHITKRHPVPRIFVPKGI